MESPSTLNCKKKGHAEPVEAWFWVLCPESCGGKLSMTTEISITPKVSRIKFRLK
jgi:hypothetical protein